MYFAINPWPSELPDALLETLNSHLQPTLAANAYALVDMSFVQGLVRRMPSLGLKAHSLYAGTRLAGLGDVAPHLVPLGDTSAQHRRRLNALAKICQGMPMLSLLLSPLSAPELCRHFSPWLVASTEDGSEWPVRWADTRVLPQLLACLHDDERADLFAPLHAWLVVDRHAQAMVWPGPGNISPSTREAPWVLDDTRFARLLDAAEADAVISQIDDQQHELLDRHLPAEVHREVSRLLVIASAAGINAASDRQHITTLGLMLKPEFTEYPAFQSLLHQTRQGANYQQTIAKLPDEFWQAYARPA